MDLIGFTDCNNRTSSPRECDRGDFGWHLVSFFVSIFFTTSIFLFLVSCSTFMKGYMMSTVPELSLTRLSISSIQTPGIVLVLEADNLELLGNAIASSHFGHHSFFSSLSVLCIFVRNENAEKVAFVLREELQFGKLSANPA